MKMILIIIVVAAVAIGTLPIWGSCEQQQTVCSTWCSVANFNSDLGRAGCKAECIADQTACLAKQAAQGIERAIDQQTK